MQLEALTSSGPRITRQLQQQMAPLAPIQGHAHKPADEEMLEAAELFLKRAHGDQGPAERGKRSRTEGWGAALPTPTASEGEGDALLQPDASKGEGDALLPPTAPEGWGDVLLPPSAASAGEGDALLPPTASEGEGDALLPPTAPEGWGDVLPSSAAFEGEGAHSQHPGVSYNVSKSKWEAYCYQGRIKISFGMFSEFHDAVLAYNDCIRIYCMDVPGGLGEVSSTPVMGIARWQTMALSELARIKLENSLLHQQLDLVGPVLQASTMLEAAGRGGTLRSFAEALASGAVGAASMLVQVIACGARNASNIFRWRSRKLDMAEATGEDVRSYNGFRIKEVCPALLHMLTYAFTQGSGRAALAVLAANLHGVVPCEMTFRRLLRLENPDAKWTSGISPPHILRFLESCYRLGLFGQVPHGEPLLVVLATDATDLQVRTPRYLHISVYLFFLFTSPPTTLAGLLA